jgi:hypothetical protein
MTITTDRTTTDAADALDALTLRQRAAQEATAGAREQLTTARHDLADTLAAGQQPTGEHLSRLATTRDGLELAELLELGLGRERQRIAAALEDGRPAPLVDDPRGLVTICIVGAAGRHACNQPSTGRPLLGGQVVAVTPDDALDLARAGYAEVSGPVPSWWPPYVAATGQLAASRA